MNIRPDGYENEAPIDFGRFRNAADAARHAGLLVGDTIIGREGASGAWWGEAKLTLIFIGKEVCVWQVEERRSSDISEDPRLREAANWSLDCREWFKLKGKGR